MPLGSSVYCGYDPTAESIHLGNMVSLITLMHFRGAGYRPIVLLGGATGLIGDPSGRSSERNLLDQTTIESNVQSFETQFGHLTSQLAQSYTKNNSDLDTTAFSDFQFVNNIDFYEKMNTVSFLRDVGKHFRVSTMLSRDSVKSRMTDIDEQNEGISFTEFSYQVLQAYDFYQLNKKENCLC